MFPQIVQILLILAMGWGCGLIGYVIGVWPKISKETEGQSPEPPPQPPSRNDILGGKPTVQDIYRILDAFEFLLLGYPDPEWDEKKKDQVTKDSCRIILSASEHSAKNALSFGKALYLAKAEYVEWVFSGYPSHPNILKPAAPPFQEMTKG